MFEDVDFDAVVGEGAGLVEAERLQVAGDDLHGADEVEAVGERRRVAAPQAEAGGRRRGRGRWWHPSRTRRRRVTSSQLPKRMKQTRHPRCLGDPVSSGRNSIRASTQRRAGCLLGYLAQRSVKSTKIATPSRWLLGLADEVLGRHHGIPDLKGWPKIVRTHPNSWTASISTSGFRRSRHGTVTANERPTSLCWRYRQLGVLLGRIKDGVVLAR